MLGNSAIYVNMDQAVAGIHKTNPKFQPSHGPVGLSTCNQEYEYVDAFRVALRKAGLSE